MTVCNFDGVNPDIGKTITAVNGAALTRVKWNGCHQRASSTFGPDFYSLASTSSSGYFDGLKASIFRLLTVFTAFGWVLQLLITEECLFAGRPDETLAAVDALN